MLCSARRRGGVRAIRGAISVADNTRDDILSASRELLDAMIQANGLDESEVVSILFTLTVDLNQAFPAEAARELGWTQVPLMCMQEVDVPGAEPKVVRVLITTTRTGPLDSVRHVYRGAAQRLRPDWGPQPPAHSADRRGSN